MADVVWLHVLYCTTGKGSGIINFFNRLEKSDRIALLFVHVPCVCVCV